jgi:small basic protein (TIGR04137 family)
MSIDKSLRRKSGIARNRSVLTRDERIKVLVETERWSEGRSPYGLPKVRVMKISTKKVKKEKAAEGEAASGTAAPAGDAKAAAGAKAGAKPAAAAKPAAKADAKPGKK